MKNNNKKNNNGITLIALVITIIVLLILAGVAISMLSGENGILKQAADAKVRTEEKTELERVQLAVLSAITAGEGKVDLEKGSNKDNSIDNALNKEFENDSKKPKYEKGKIILSNGEIHTVTTSGSLEKVEEEKITFSKTGDLEIGSEVTASNGDKFFVIGFSADNTEVKLLSKYNLKKEGDTITTEQFKENTTMDEDTYMYSNAVAFSSSNYWSSYEGSYPLDLNKNYVAERPTGTALEYAKIYGRKLGVETGRLMTKEEADGLSSKTDILYGTIDCNYLNYWLGSANDGDYDVLVVYGDGSFLDCSSFDNGSSCGVRPVIEVLTSSIK